MTDKEILIRKLQTFKRHGFRGWAGPIEFFEVDFDAFQQGVWQCVDELIEAVNNNASTRELKKVMLPYITHLRHLQIGETEEREYVSQIYYELSQIIPVDVSFQLNRVIYGWLLTALTTNPFTKKGRLHRSEDIKKTLTNKCTSCGYEMRTNIINHNQEREDEKMEVTMHAIVACKVCGELDLIFITEDGELVYSYDYYMKEEFPEDWTLEQARQRMEQVKQWRK